MLWVGGPVDRCSITLRITGDGVFPDEISLLLGRKPSFATTKGEPVYASDGRVLRIAKRGAWHLTLTSEDSGEWEVQEVIRKLLSMLPSDLDLWHSLAEAHDIDLFCGLFLNAGNRGFELPVDVLQALAERRIKVGFDIYGPGPLGEHGD